MGHEDCLGWEYETHPNNNSVIHECAEILVELSHTPRVHDTVLQDSRPAHQRVFHKVTPAACSYLAGNYRGSNHPCLARYAVHVGPHIGSHPICVDEHMRSFHDDLNQAIQKLDGISSAAKKQSEKSAVMPLIVDVCAATLERFLTIHPYANGNGHTARLLVWILLIRYGRVPVQWTLEKSPPGYGDLIQKHRSGDRNPLRRFILLSIIGQAA